MRPSGSISLARARIATTVVALVLSGCAALSGLDELAEQPSSSPLNEEAGPQTTPDGSVTTSTTTDGSITSNPVADSSAIDGATTNDAGDAGDSGGGVIDAAPDTFVPPPLGFCASLATKPTLCTDFDDGVFPGPWSVSVSGVATAASDTTTSRSAPRSVFFNVPTNSATQAHLRKTFAQPVTQIFVGFSARLESLNTGATDYEFATIRLGALASGPYELQLEHVSGQLNLEEEIPADAGASAETNTLLGVPWALDTWRRVELTVAISGNSSTLTIAAEGAAPVVRNVSAHNWLAPAIVIINLDSGTAGLKTHFDDIVVNVK